MILAHDDLLKLITADAATIDVTVAYRDEGQNASLPKSQQTAITTATTTTILATPGAGTSRTPLEISIRNKDTATCSVTPVIVGSSITTQLHKATLLGGGHLHWTEGSGWVATTPGEVGVSNTVVLATNVVNDLASAAYANVTGLSFAVLADLAYWFRFVIRYDAAATTTGSGWAINGPAAPTYLHGRSHYTIAATTETNNTFTAYDIPAAANTDSLTTGNVAVIEGVITPSVAGTVIARFISGANSSAITALAGSFLEWKRVI